MWRKDGLCDQWTFPLGSHLKSRSNCSSGTHKLRAVNIKIQSIALAMTSFPWSKNWLVKNHSDHLSHVMAATGSQQQRRHLWLWHLEKMEVSCWFSATVFPFYSNPLDTSRAHGSQILFFSSIALRIEEIQTHKHTHTYTHTYTHTHLTLSSSFNKVW